MPTRSLALATAVLFGLLAIIDIPHDQPDPFASPVDYAMEVCFALALMSGAATLGALSRAASSRIAAAGWLLGAAGLGLVAVAATATAVVGSDTWEVLFLLGLPLLIVGALVVAGADVARRVDPRFAGLALLVGVVGMFALGDGYGVVAVGAAFFAISLLLQRPASAATRTGTRELAR